ncbi:MAG: polysaccharide deacetylase family protein [Oscillospiraceae bacterium]
MIIKINYNYVAAFISLTLVISFFLVELLLPSSVRADVTANSEDNYVKLPVAMYHHILNSPSKLGDYVISPMQFEEDLEYIQKSGYTTITSVQLLDFIQNGTALPKKPIMITFDDGYESVHEYAYPLLQKYNMKAVLSIIGKHTDIFSNKDEPRHINYSHLSWDQLRKMQQSGVFEIQNHSYSMHLPQGSPRYGIRIKKGESEEDYKAALIEDIGGLSDQITHEIGVAPTVFAYPFGAHCKQSQSILDELGFKIILTCEERINKISSNSDFPLKLKRFNRASKYSTFDFYSKLFK